MSALPDLARLAAALFAGAFGSLYLGAWVWSLPPRGGRAAHRAWLAATRRFDERLAASRAGRPALVREQRARPSYDPAQRERLEATLYPRLRAVALAHNVSLPERRDARHAQTTLRWELDGWHLCARQLDGPSKRWFQVFLDDRTDEVFVSDPDPPHRRSTPRAPHVLRFHPRATPLALTAAQLVTFACDGGAPCAELPPSLVAPALAARCLATPSVAPFAQRVAPFAPCEIDEARTIFHRQRRAACA